MICCQHEISRDGTIIRSSFWKGLNFNKEIEFNLFSFQIYLIHMCNFEITFDFTKKRVNENLQFDHTLVYFNINPQI